MSKSIQVTCPNCKKRGYVFHDENNDYSALQGNKYIARDSAYYEKCQGCGEWLWIPPKDYGRQSVTVITLADEINQEHELTCQSAYSSFAHALRAGELLCQVKEYLPHGEFIEWVNDNCRFAIRMAQNYMLLHQKRDELANTQSITHLKNGEYTVTGALKIIEGKKYRTAEKEKMAELDQAVKEYLDKSKLFRYTINQGIETLRDGKFTESDRAFTINRNILLINQLQEFNGLLGAEVIDE